MKHIALFLCLLSGCTQAKVPNEIYLKVDVYHHPGVYPPYRDGLPEGAHVVLPAVNPSDDGAVIPQR